MFHDTIHLPQTAKKKKGLNGHGLDTSHKRKQHKKINTLSNTEQRQAILNTTHTLHRNDTLCCWGNTIIHIHTQWNPAPEYNTLALYFAEYYILWWYASWQMMILSIYPAKSEAKSTRNATICILSTDRLRDQMSEMTLFQIYSFRSVHQYIAFQLSRPALTELSPLCPHSIVSSLGIAPFRVVFRLVSQWMTPTNNTDNRHML